MTEERERNQERSLSIYTHVPSPYSFLGTLFSFFPPFALRSRYGCLLGLNGQDRLNLRRSCGEVGIKSGALKSVP